MGVMYLNGWGVKPSHRQALECFTIAAQVGHVLGMYNLAVMHLNGRAGLPDADARLSCPPALALMKKIAEKGSWGGLVQQVCVQLTSVMQLKCLAATVPAGILYHIHATIKLFVRQVVQYLCSTQALLIRHSRAFAAGCAERLATDLEQLLLALQNYLQVCVFCTSVQLTPATSAAGI